MQSSARRPAHRALKAMVVILALSSTGGIFFAFTQQHTPFSSPTKVRPWAEAEFRALTMPVPSPGMPTDPQYTAKCGPPVFGRSPHGKGKQQVAFEVEPAAESYQPPYQIIEFNAADGFTSAEGGGWVRWLAARNYLRPGDYQKGRVPAWKMFDPNGTPLSRKESDAKSIREEPRLGSRENSPVLHGCMVLNDYPDASWRLRQIFDAGTHVPLMSHGTMVDDRTGTLFKARLKARHDAPLLAVFDLNHGPIQEFPCEPIRGAVGEQPGFKFEVIETTDVKVDTLSVGHSSYYLNSNGHSTSVIYRVTPRSMSDSVILEALDSEGKRIQGRGRYVNELGYRTFDVPVRKISSLRVRFRPKFTRLLMHIDALPAVYPGNLKPTNLFDVTAPEITFDHIGEMEQFIADTVQFKMLSWANPPGATFPMTLHYPTPQSLVERYIAMDPKKHKVIVDPVAQTIRFESMPKPSMLDRAIQWLKHPTWKP